MAKRITRTFTTYQLDFVDAKTQAVVHSQVYTDKPNEYKEVAKYAKANNLKTLYPVVTEIEELRGMDVETFLQFSTVEQPREKKATDNQANEATQA